MIFASACDNGTLDLWLGSLDLCLFVGVPAFMSVFQAYAHAKSGTFTPLKVVWPLFCYAMSLMFIGCVLMTYWVGTPLAEMFIISSLIAVIFVVLGFPASILAYIAFYAIVSRFVTRKQPTDTVSNASPDNR